jgi:hypothetical protein
MADETIKDVFEKAEAGLVWEDLTLPPINLLNVPILNKENLYERDI